MVVKSIADYIQPMTPTGVSVYMLIFLGIVLIGLAVSGETVFPGYLVVFFMFIFTIWYIYVKLIVPDPLQL